VVGGGSKLCPNKQLFRGEIYRGCNLHWSSMRKQRVKRAHVKTLQHERLSTAFTFGLGAGKNQTSPAAFASGSDAWFGFVAATLPG